MKAFFILVIFVLTFFLIASSSLANVDLTPDTPAATDAGAAETFQAEPQVIMVQDQPVVQNQVVIPVTGTCTNPYTVQPGDILSGIAVLCNTTVGDIRLANPGITNINLIYPGQQLTIPSGTNPQPIPVTGDKTGSNAVVIPSPTPAALVPNIAAPVGIAQGTTLRVQALNFPATIAVNIGLSQQNSIENIVLGSGVTDTNGNLVTTVRLPDHAIPAGYWVVVVYTTGTQRTEASSKPFQVISQ